MIARGTARHDTITGDERPTCEEERKAVESTKSMVPLQREGPETCQGEGRGFESRLPLQVFHPSTVTRRALAARLLFSSSVGTLSYASVNPAGVAEWQTQRS